MNIARVASVGVILQLVIAAANAGTMNLWVADNDTDPGMPAIPTDVEVSDTLYLWASFTPGERWNSINFDLLDTGDGDMNNDELIPMSGFTRWDESSDFTGSTISLEAATSQGLGSTFESPAGGPYLLGTIVAEASIGLLQGVAGTNGFARQDGDVVADDVMIGGDTSFAVNDSTTVATLWTPEPASLVLIALAGLAIRRR